MSKMSELAAEIDELVEQGMSAKFIAVALKIPMQWAEDAVNERKELELQKQQEMMSYGDE
mgnify:CR=1 FL=1